MHLCIQFLGIVHRQLDSLNLRGKVLKHSQSADAASKAAAKAATAAAIAAGERRRRQRLLAGGLHEEEARGV